MGGVAAAAAAGALVYCHNNPAATYINVHQCIYFTLSFSNISCKPLVGVAGDAGMKKLEFAATGFEEANAAGCFGPLIANFGSFSSVIFCLRRLKNTSAPLNVGVVWSTDFSNFSKKFGRRQKDNNIF